MSGGHKSIFVIIVESPVSSSVEDGQFGRLNDESFERDIKEGLGSATAVVAAADKSSSIFRSIYINSHNFLEGNYFHTKNIPRQAFSKYFVNHSTHGSAKATKIESSCLNEIPLQMLPMGMWGPENMKIKKFRWGLFEFYIFLS